MKKIEYKVVIVDDEDICIENIRQSLKEFPELEVVGIAGTSENGKKLILEKQPDILFLDVEMPDKTGIELMHELQDRINWNMQVVFYTAYNKYLIEALRASAFDFLLKPYNKEEFDGIISRFYNQTKKEIQSDYLKSLLAATFPSNQTFMLTTVKGFQFLKAENILFFEYNRLKKNWTVELSDKKQVQLKRGTTAEDIQNYSVTFVQISQCHIINIEYLSIIHDNYCILFPPHDLHPLKISRTFLRQVQDKFEAI